MKLGLSIRFFSAVLPVCMYLFSTACAGAKNNNETGQEECLERWEGENFHETSAVISGEVFSPDVPVVFIASGVITVDGPALDYPDILISGPAAAASGGPVLLVSADNISQAVQRELTRLRPQKIVVLGGPVAISDDVVTSLAAFTSGEVSRIAGDNRFSTAAALSQEVFEPNVPVAVIALSSGDELAESLAAAPAAAALGGPILLARSTIFPEETKTELTRLQPQSILIVGATISSAIESQLAAFTAGAVTRVTGSDRYETAAAISAQIFSPRLTVFVTGGESFPEALTGALAATATKSPILLVEKDDIPPSVSTELNRLKPKELVVVGSPTQVSLKTACELAEF